ncbi:RNA-binding domain-containing protein [Trichodelitschia bisporula]|uniref:RNA-binding domain-containing protein n=1 Tax=Trichodelitschia bisporula TaxID=703511 RepID=A0A6G1HI98_9PEZI|nr:RNA-binding domain-containing protein [Trichodelitschia bisporula]
MDRSLEDIISERQTQPRNDTRNIDQEWVHDRYDDVSDGSSTSPPGHPALTPPARQPVQNFRNTRYTRRDSDPELRQQTGTKLRVDNLHYDLSEDELRELFSRIGRVSSVQLLYDRQDRSRGIAFVVYPNPEDAQDAIREFDGANAHGQPIRITLQNSPPVKPRNPFDNIERPPRSLFDRIERPATSSRGGRGDRGRSASPIRHSNVSKPAPEHIDRYVPGDDRRRSPRRGTPRGNLKRAGGPGGPGGAGGRRQRSPRRDTGEKTVQGRPRKTAEELDAEMEDYWGAAGGGGAEQSTGHGAADADDDLMIE